MRVLCCNLENYILLIQSNIYMEYTQNNLNAARGIQGIFLCYSDTALCKIHSILITVLFYFFNVFRMLLE